MVVSDGGLERDDDSRELLAHGLLAVGVGITIGAAAVWTGVGLAGAWLIQTIMDLVT